MRVLVRAPFRVRERITAWVPRERMAYELIDGMRVQGDTIPDDGRSRAPVSSIAVPTLVIHGTADPMFALEHGEALAEEISTARLLALQGAGHGVDPADWETIVRAIVEHTAPTHPTTGC